MGNLAFGGRGKTPLAAYLAGRLVAAQRFPAILSRGYGRRDVADGVVVVSDGTHVLADIDRAGDEPLMLARSVPGAAVLVCEERAIAAAFALRVLGARSLLLDDGFQHTAVARDIDLVVLSPEDLHRRRVPLGPLREGPRALRRASAAIVDGGMSDADRRSVPVPVFAMGRQLDAPLALEAGGVVPPAGSDVVAVAGIANPGRFGRSLAEAGWNVRQLVQFGDHHRYVPADLRTIAGALAGTGAAAVFTTAKDAVRLRRLRPLPFDVCVVPMKVTFDPREGFDDWFDARCREVAE